MARDDSWFKNTTWTPEIAAKFEQRFARTRSNKRHPLTTQAGFLVRYGIFDEGVLLYRRAAALESLPADERTMVLGWLAQALIAARRFDDAIEAAREAVQSSPPHARNMRGARTPEELLAFGLRQRGNPGDDDEALALLSQEDPYLRESLDRLRERFAGVDVADRPYADAEDLAEAFVVSLHQMDVFSDKADVDALFAASPAALAALDRSWCAVPPMFGAYDALRRRFVFEAGGYVGRVLCRAGGAWAPGSSPVTSTVLFQGHTVDPFAIAYEALLRFKPLTRSFAEANAP